MWRILALLRRVSPLLRRIRALLRRVSPLLRRIPALLPWIRAALLRRISALLRRIRALLRRVSPLRRGIRAVLLRVCTPLLRRIRALLRSIRALLRRVCTPLMCLIRALLRRVCALLRGIPALLQSIERRRRHMLRRVHVSAGTVRRITARRVRHHSRLHKPKKSRRRQCPGDTQQTTPIHASLPRTSRNAESFPGGGGEMAKLSILRTNSSRHYRANDRAGGQEALVCG